MYEPKIKVVRKMGANSWYLDDGRDRSAERAYLVRGLPMPGDKVVVTPTTGEPYKRTVAGVEFDDYEGVVCVRFTNGGWDPLQMVKPHDPDAGRLRVALESVRAILGAYAEAPCFTDLLGDELDRPCTCPTCGHRAALFAARKALEATDE